MPPSSDGPGRLQSIVLLFFQPVSFLAVCSIHNVISAFLKKSTNACEGVTCKTRNGVFFFHPESQNDALCVLIFRTRVADTWCREKSLVMHEIRAAANGPAYVSTHSRFARLVYLRVHITLLFFFIFFSIRFSANGANWRANFNLEKRADINGFIISRVETASPFAIPSRGQRPDWNEREE